MSRFVKPQGGRLVRRAVSGGSAWAGVLHLPQEFVPEEGRAYGCLITPQGLSLAATPASGPLDEQQLAYGAGDLLTQPIWPRPAVPEAISVRFLAAFPETNVWTVFGPSPVQMDRQAPSHTWFDVDTTGQLSQIQAPFDADGDGFGQLLTNHAVWPNRDGALYSVPQNHSAIRPHYLAYHQLLAQAARNPDVSDTLEETVAKHPVFRQFSICRIDRMFCSFLAQMEDERLLEVDRPYSAQEIKNRETNTLHILARSLDRDPPVRRPGPR